jgi:lipid-A-disaccharide synthase
VILPFEKEFYETKWDFKVDYVGHPLVKVIDDFLNNNSSKKENEKPVIALLPGSRQQEVAAKLPIMLGASKAFPQYKFVIAKASSLDDAFYDRFLKDHQNVSSSKNDTYTLLSTATAALVTSGTATLETALFGVPQVVCYKGSSVSYHIAKRLIKIKYISLVNLIMDREVVKELIQADLTVKNVIRELDLLLNNTEKKQQLKNDYQNLKNLLQQGGNASEKAATIIVRFLQAICLPKA